MPEFKKILAAAHDPPFIFLSNPMLGWRNLAKRDEWDKVPGTDNLEEALVKPLGG